MKKFLCLLGIFLLFGEGLWAVEKKEGTVTISYLEGKVEVLKKAEKDWKKAKLYTELSAGDRIRTLLVAKCDLKLSDGSLINIKENSIMDITQLLEDGEKTNSSFKLWMGEIKARIQRLKTKDSSMSFHTPTAVMGLRGTTVWLTVDWRGRTRCGFTEGNGYIQTDKEGEKAINEGQEADVSLEGDVTINTTEESAVPNLVGMQLSEARSAVVTAELVIGQIMAKESTEPQDEVLSQDPKSGVTVPKHSEVNIVVAISIQPIVVPDLIEMTRAEAEAKITEENLVVGSIFEDYDETSPINTVMKQNPQPGMPVKEGANVDLLISKGHQPRVKVTVPNLFGMTIAEARSLLRKAGLNFGEVLGKEGTGIGEGLICDQMPKPNAEADEGSFVKVWKAVLVTRPIPVINHQFSTAKKFVTEIPSLNLRITPNNPNWAPLLLNIDGRRIQLSAPPYFTTYRPTGIRIGENIIRVSAQFEGGEETSLDITAPYYDPIPP
ncbi:PASTA domain-containing protein, partial [bacterium]|nr:PASTA domain-containing protein [bacterium]